MAPLTAIRKAKRILYDPEGSPDLIVTKADARRIVDKCRSHDSWAGHEADLCNYWLEFTLRENGDLLLSTNLDTSTSHEDEFGSNSWPGSERDI